MVTVPSPSRIISSYSAVPIACATPPSTWPRHCSGFITKPASAACTDCRIRTSPVAVSTATRKPCTLNASERGAPSWRPVGGQRAAGLDQVGERRAACRPRVQTVASGAPAVARDRRPGRPRRARSSRQQRGRGRVHGLARRRPCPPSRTRRCRSAAASVSDCRTRTRAASVPSALATSWVCTVVVPLPNSAVPTRSV